MDKKKLYLWFLATRPKTLLASQAPILLSFSLSFQYQNLIVSDLSNHISFIYIICSLFSFCIQICTNFANEYFDFKRGADTKKRLGPQRSVSLGLINDQQMLYASVLFGFFAFSIGCTLLQFSGVEILIIGVLSVLLAFLYTGGPYPLAYNGLGDLFVIFFFGIIAVCIPFYILYKSIPWDVFILSVGMGMIINNLLVINNYRDFEEDKQSNKRTTTVMFGRKFSYFQYVFSYLFGVVMVPIFLFAVGNKILFLSLFILLIPAYKNSKSLLKSKSSGDYNIALKKTAIFMMGYSIMISLILLFYTKTIPFI